MTEARWFGHITRPNGILHDHFTVDGLIKMACPTTGGQLQLFLFAMQWLRSAILNIQTLTQELHDFLKHVYAHVGKHTKGAIDRVSLADLRNAPTPSRSASARLFTVPPSPIVTKTSVCASTT